ncbi:MAG: 2-hydroxyacid dehydrogenase [Maribacter sp.]
MKLLVYSDKAFEVPFLKDANTADLKITYLKEALDTETAIKAMGYQAISIFSGDDASAIVLEKLWDLGVKFITIRSSGYNNLNIKAAKRLGFRVANAPNYAPHAIAEHAVALLLAFNRKLIKADRQVHNFNFLQDDLMGFNLHGKTVGIIGTGRIGSIMAKIMHGFGCKILANDPNPDSDLIEMCDVSYTSLKELCTTANIISLHIPMNYDNRQLINHTILGLMRHDVILINTARGELIDMKALIEALNNHTIGGYCTDVYEHEKGIFFKNNATDGIKDEQLRTLLSFSNVLLTPHQAFVTKEALANIAAITIENLESWRKGIACENELGLDLIHS